MQYDLAVIGAGPGGYTAAIRAAELGMKTIVIEKENLGGVCLNQGCIPTKTLLKSAEIYREVRQAAFWGTDPGTSPEIRLESMITRVRTVSENLRKGIDYLFKKYGVETLQGSGALTAPHEISITGSDGVVSDITARNILLATGSVPRNLPGMEPDGTRIWTSREALSPEKLPSTLLVIGSGAIGSELAWFYRSLGVRVLIVEMQSRLIPLEDQELSEQLERAFKKSGIKVWTDTTVKQLEKTGAGCLATLQNAKKEEQIEIEIVLLAAGVVPNTKNLGLENAGIALNGRFIQTDKNYHTTTENHYAIGDLIATPALAHVASAEGTYIAEYIAGLNPEPVDYQTIPSCIFTEPEIASVGMNEKTAGEAGIRFCIGRCAFAGIGKAQTINRRDGFVKLIFEQDKMQLIGAQLAGAHVSEMISGLSLAKRLGATAQDIAGTIHPHPTLSEAIREAAVDALRNH
jgi:dihydrolipoamide dehydrogenase